MKFLRFSWQVKKYKYTTLPFGFSAAPRVFMKLLKPLLARFREREEQEAYRGFL